MDADAAGKKSNDRSGGLRAAQCEAARRKEKEVLSTFPSTTVHPTRWTQIGRTGASRSRDEVHSDAILEKASDGGKAEKIPASRDAMCGEFWISW